MNIYDNPNNDQPNCPIRFWNVEEWRYITRKSVPDIIDETSYMISSFGRAYTNKTHRFMKLTPTCAGYFRIALTLKDYRTRYYLVHRIVKIEFDECKDYQNLTVNHLDDDRVDNFIWNLDWATMDDNIKYANIIRHTDMFKKYICTYKTMSDTKRNFILNLLSENYYTFKDIANLAGCSFYDIERIAKENGFHDV